MIAATCALTAPISAFISALKISMSDFIATPRKAFCKPSVLVFACCSLSPPRVNVRTYLRYPKKVATMGGTANNTPNNVKPNTIIWSDLRFCS